jgi:hypothetical protein
MRHISWIATVLLLLSRLCYPQDATPTDPETIRQLVQQLHDLQSIGKSKTRFNIHSHLDGCMFAWQVCIFVCQGGFLTISRVHWRSRSSWSGFVYLLERLRSFGQTNRWNGFAHCDSSTKSIEHDFDKNCPNVQPATGGRCLTNLIWPPLLSTKGSWPDRC